jgi:hypothetical protein
MGLEIFDKDGKALHIADIVDSYFAFAEYLKNYTWHDNTSKGDIYKYNGKKYTEKEIYERWRN